MVAVAFTEYTAELLGYAAGIADSIGAERIRSVFKVGHPVEALLRIAIKENVNLIVMGIKGRSDLEHMLVGSVAEKVFRRSPIPILSYRDTKNADRLKKHIGIK